MKTCIKLTALLSFTVLTGCYSAISPNFSVNSPSTAVSPETNIAAETPVASEKIATPEKNATVDNVVPAPEKTATPTTPEAVEPPVKEAVDPSAKEYVLSSDLIFDTDKSSLSKEGQATLEKVATEIKAAGAKFIVIAGYTDRLGTVKNNLKFSQTRADAVKLYLQEKGIEANITALGRGKANQIKACDNVAEKELTECLKPNRRIVIRAE
ncbi:hypothetical protein A1D29_09630 [Pasteurellaceae bacterium Orientalotternb1]|nr:hypothetical protein A1D29_09630 [Pasteurellaceae bacterium Orientalotternb1]